MPTWNDIIREHTADVLNAAFRVLGNVTDAEDVTQEVFAEAYRKWDANSDQRWSGLLRKLSICRAIDLLRTRKPSETLSPTIGDNKTISPIEATMTRELQNRLRIETGKLPSREAQVFCLVYFEKLGIGEVAETLGITSTAVTSALSQARLKLEKTLLEMPQGEFK